MDAALKRKGKGDDVTEDDMAVVVHAHNSATFVSQNITFSDLKSPQAVICSFSP